jgi:hypothetical protein
MGVQDQVVQGEGEALHQADLEVQMEAVQVAVALD